jgi:hypothetical protein
MSTIEENFDAFSAKCRNLGLSANVPLYDQLGRRTVGVNQNQGAIIYPFASSCTLAGIVSDIGVIINKKDVSEVYVQIYRTGGILEEKLHNWRQFNFSKYEKLANNDLLKYISSDIFVYPRLVFSSSKDVSNNQNILLDTTDLISSIRKMDFGIGVMLAD